MGSIPTTREAVRSVWEGGAPDYSGVTDGAIAGVVLTGLLRAAQDMLAYRRLRDRPEAISLVAGDSNGYLSYASAVPRTADNAVVLAHALAANAGEARRIGELLGATPPFSSVRIVILSLDGGCVLNRLDLDPESRGGVSWYGPFDGEQFHEIAMGFVLLVTHLVANVFDDDDGSETFDESFEWVV